MELRNASEKDIPVIMKLIVEFAEYENLSHSVTVTEDDLRKWIFEKHKAEIIICEHCSHTIGFITYFYNYSTFAGKPGIYLEDIYLKPKYRRKGFGKFIIEYLTKYALEQGCSHMDWTCLKTNESGMDFYKSLGAQHLASWILYRLFLSSEIVTELELSSSNDMK